MSVVRILLHEQFTGRPVKAMVEVDGQATSSNLYGEAVLNVSDGQHILKVSGQGIRPSSFPLAIQGDTKASFVVQEVFKAL